ncbi:MAG TPA: MerR family transcriptional regulator [Micromonosporaceae bacterium]
MSYSVGQVATLAGVTVRTLHHYDEIGLLTPADRSATGYRRYHDADLQRLQEIMFYRELGFSLEEITDLVHEPDANPAAHLRRQHELLLSRLERTHRMVEAVEKAMEAHTMGISLTPEERFEVFGDFDPAEHEDEARERWGETDACAESARRTSAYTKDDWLAIRAEADGITRAYADAMASGAAADSAVAMDVAERHRGHIDHWFYSCSYSIHSGLGEMYVADSRFAAHYEAVAVGLAGYVRSAILANARRSA